MKKFFLLLGMLACMTGLVACGSEQNEVQAPTNYELQIASGIESFVDALAKGQIDAFSAPDMVAAWNSALPEIGTYQKVISSEAKMYDDKVIVDVTIAGSEHNAVVEYIAEYSTGTESLTVNVSYSMIELMQKAGLNTAMGMGTVFAVLILISLIISCFNLLPKIQAAFNKQPAAAQTPIPAAAPAPVTAPASAQEDLTDDLELVAVIAAAIAASEGAVSTDGFVVRSIRKVNKSKWQSA